jgi:integrase
MAYIRELPNGKYRILWRENAVDDYGSPIKGQYRQRSETVATAKQADRRRIDIEREIESGHDPSSKRDKAATALGTYAKRYFDAAESRIGRVTLDGYRKVYRRHIADTFGSRPVGSILPSDVSTWFSALLAGESNRYEADSDPDNPQLAKRNPKTAKQALGVLRRICNVAVLDGAIIANPALVKLTTSTKRNGQQRFKHCPLTPAQIAALASHITNNQHNPIYGLVVTFDGFTGLRAAEVAGLEIRDLTLSDIPATAGAVRVERTKKKDGATWVTEATKTDESERTVPLEPWLADDLRDYLRTHPRATDPTAPLFPGRLNLAQAKAQGRSVKDSADRFDWFKPLDMNNVYKRNMQPALAACKLPKARFHDLRHSFAVNLLSATPPVDFKRASKWLGHSTFTLTLDVYGDYINDDVSRPAGLSRPVARESTISNLVSMDRRSS